MAGWLTSHPHVNILCMKVYIYRAQISVSIVDKSVICDTVWIKMWLRITGNAYCVSPRTKAFWSCSGSSIIKHWNMATCDRIHKGLQESKPLRWWPQEIVCVSFSPVIIDLLCYAWIWRLEGLLNEITNFVVILPCFIVKLILNWISHVKMKTCLMIGQKKFAIFFSCIIYNSQQVKNIFITWNHIGEVMVWW